MGLASRRRRYSARKMALESLHHDFGVRHIRHEASLNRAFPLCLPQGRRPSADFRPWKSKTTSTPRAVLFDLLIALLETCASSTAISRPTRIRFPMAVPVWARSRISPDGTAGCRAAGRCGAASTRSSRAGFDAAHAFHRPRDATAHRGRASSRGPRSAPHARASEAPARVGEGPRAASPVARSTRLAVRCTASVRTATTGFPTDRAGVASSEPAGSSEPVTTGRQRCRKQRACGSQLGKSPLQPGQ